MLNTIFWIFVNWVFILLLKLSQKNFWVFFDNLLETYSIIHMRFVIDKILVENLEWQKIASFLGFAYAFSYTTITIDIIFFIFLHIMFIIVKSKKTVCLLYQYSTVLCYLRTRRNAEKLSMCWCDRKKLGFFYVWFLSTPENSILFRS